MSHAFFDARSFPWHRAEAATAHRALYQAIRRPEQIDLLYQQSASGLAPLALGNPPHEIWKDVLERLTLARRLRQLCELILADVNLAAIHPAIQAIVAAQPADEPDEAAPRIPSESARIRELMTDSLSDAEIDELALDRFPTVYNEFSSGMSKTTKIHRLLDYCTRRRRLGELHEAVKAMQSR